MKLPNNLNNLIEILKEIKDKYGDKIPVSINLFHDRILGLQSICIDNSDDEVQIFFEADYEDKAECLKDFEVYTTGGELDESTDTFETDLEKMVDLLEAVMSEDNASAYDEFLRSYSYITENELDDTVGLIDAEVLADLYRQAENYYIEELNGRPTGLAITSEQAKSTIVKYVYDSGLMSKGEQREFEELCEAMAC